MLDETLNKIKVMQSKDFDKFYSLDPQLNKMKQIEVRTNQAMLEKDQKAEIHNEVFNEVANCTYEEIASRSQALGLEIEIRNEKRQAYRMVMLQRYADADETRRDEMRKHSIVPQSFRDEDNGPKPVKKKYNLTPEEKREKRIDSTMKMFNLTREKAIKYLDNFDED